MTENLGKAELTAALDALGQEIRGPVQLVLGGAGALILTGELSRTTSDCDVLSSDPDMGQLQSAIRNVAQRLHLTGGWLNGSVQSYLDVLPLDFRDRLRSLPSHGHLRVWVIHRQDFVVMKLFAARPRDLDDIRLLNPSDAELAFARTQLPRLQRLAPNRAADMESILDHYAPPD